MNSKETKATQQKKQTISNLSGEHMELLHLYCESIAMILKNMKNTAYPKLQTKKQNI